MEGIDYVDEKEGKYDTNAIIGLTSKIFQHIRGHKFKKFPIKRHPESQ